MVREPAVYSRAAMSGYTTQDVARMIGVSAGRLRAYLRAGVLSPERGERGELRFSFQDLLLLRKAEGLVSERIPPHRVRRALQKLRARLPDDAPAHRRAARRPRGPRSSSQEGDARWQAESGQVLLSFDGRRRAEAEVPLAPLAMLRARPPAERSPTSRRRRTEEIYEIGCDIDETDPVARRGELPPGPDAGARSTPTRTSTWGASSTSAAIWRPPRRTTGARWPSARTTPRRCFNLGVALEDQGRNGAALDAYARAIEADGRNADAHYNAARLYDLARRLRRGAAPPANLPRPHPNAA